MVDDKALDPKDSISLVKKYFEDNYKRFKIIKETSHAGYWWIEYFSDPYINVYFDGDASGHFSIKVSIDKKEYFLWQYDRSVNQATLSTEKNIIYQLQVLGNFLGEER